MTHHRVSLIACVLLAVVALASGCQNPLSTETGTAQPVVILSSQAALPTDAGAMHTQVLGPLDVPTAYVTVDQATLFDRVFSESSQITGSVDLIVTVHSNFSTFEDAGLMADLAEIESLNALLESRAFIPSVIDLHHRDPDTRSHLPLMQATYLLVAHRDALDDLPPDADAYALTWDDLLAWAQNLNRAYGSPQLGLPAGPDGLLPHLLQGYLYPSFTGGMVTNFTGPDAEAMWDYTRDLWAVTDPESRDFAEITTPLLNGDIRLGFDHVAHLRPLFESAPNQYIALPAPHGPYGAGFIPLLVGVGIPANAPQPEAAAAVIAALTEPQRQIALLNATGFFPVTEVTYPNGFSRGLLAEASAVSIQASNPAALPALLPVGLGPNTNNFNDAFRRSFDRIVLGNEPIQRVLRQEAVSLQRTLNRFNTPCVPPDPVGYGVCTVQ